MYRARSGRYKSRLGRWLQGFLKKGSVPTIALLQTAKGDGRPEEKAWIRKLHRLVNTTAGGNGASTRAAFPAKYISLLGKKTDSEIAQVTGMSRENVGYHRRRLGVPAAPFDRSHSFDHRKGVPPWNKTMLPKRVVSQLGKVSDIILAKEAGCSHVTIANHRMARRIAACPQVPFCGSRHPSSKLTRQLVRNIRSEYVPYKVPIWRLAKKYSLHFETVWRIVNHQTFLDRRP
jgi:hypothetical protein